MKQWRQNQTSEFQGVNNFDLSSSAKENLSWRICLRISGVNVLFVALTNLRRGTNPSSSLFFIHGLNLVSRSEDDDEALITEDDLQLQFYDEYDAGGYSPRLLKASELEPDQIVYDPEDDMKRLEYARNHVMKTGQTVSSTCLA